MEGNNLMDFQSPMHSEFLRRASLGGHKISPGSNPFDDVLRKASTQSYSLSTSHNVLDVSPSRMFQTSFESFDIGRESIPFIDIPNASGRESLGLLKFEGVRDANLLNLTIQEDYGRESLGILHIRTPDVSFNLLDDVFIPDIQVSVTPGSSKLRKKDMTNNFNTAFLLPNAAKISAGSSTSSTGSAVPSYNSVFPGMEEPSKIYSVSPRKSNTCRSGDSDLNNAFIETNLDINKDLLNNSSKFEKYDNKNSSFQSEISSIYSIDHIHKNGGDKYRSRINSLPLSMGKDNKLPPLNDSQVSMKNVVQREGIKFWSCDRVKKVKPFRRGSFSERLNFDEKEEDLYGLLFVEASQFASKVADGSIFQDSDEDDLDKTKPPELFADLERFDEKMKEEEEKPKQETVFKAVDKLIPQSESQSEKQLRFTRKRSSSSDDLNHSNISQISAKNCSNKIHQSLTDLNDDSKLSTNSRKSNRSAREIIQNLSEILSNNNKSDSQRQEGQNLLSSLAGMLLESDNQQNSDANLNNSDSGHSSIDGLEIETMYPPQTNEEKASVSQDNPINLDQSVQRNARRLSQSFNFQNPKILPPRFQNILVKSSSSDESSTEKRNVSNSSSGSGGERNMSCASFNGSKLKPKKMGDSVGGSSKKGPMRAVLPVSQMVAKPAQTVQTKSISRIQTTPSKMDHRPLSLSKRTSTPIKDSKIAPMAQSTPELGSPTEKYQRRLMGPLVSPLTRPSSLKNIRKTIDMEKISSGSTPNLSLNKNTPDSSANSNPSINKSTSLSRRNSVTELRKPKPVDVKLKRSVSINSSSAGRDVKIMSALSKVRSNIANSPYYKPGNVLMQNNSMNNSKGSSESLNSGERSHRSFIAKPSNLFSNIKHSNKENISK